MAPDVTGGIRRDLGRGRRGTPLFFVAMSDEKIKVRDLRNGDWYWISKVLLDEYGGKIKPIGIAVYNCLAEHANQEGFCFPSHKHIADRIGASISSVQRGIQQMIKLGIIRKGRRRYSNVYYLLKLDRSDRPNSNKTGQSDWHIGHTDLSDRSVGTTNKNKEKEFIKKNYGVNKKTVDNLNEIKAMLAEKMSIEGIKIKIIDGKKHMWSGKQWIAVEDT
jgi:DNA replication protein DnaD